MTCRFLVLLLAAEILGYGSCAKASEVNVPVDLPTRCESLQTEDFSDTPDAPTQLTSSSVVPMQAALPAHCQVSGYIAPNVGIKLGLPFRWNGKFMEIGCAGHCGILDDVFFARGCRDALRRGYACVISDSGHKGRPKDGLWGAGDLQAKIDWGYRAAHVTALAGKAIVKRFYTEDAAKSYFMGCSTGGRQALQEAQRFPSDFNGIVAGGPPVKLSTVYLTFGWGIRATHTNSGKPLLSNDELKLLADAATAKCDLDDGVKDGVIGDPLHCPFDPAELACVSGRSKRCLTPEQIEAAKKVYAGPMTSAGTMLSRGGPLPGSEYVPWLGEQTDWSSAYVGLGGKPSQYEAQIRDGFRFLFFFPEPGASWDFPQLDFDRDYLRLKVMDPIYGSSDPDLREFKSAGGKMIIYQGLNDISVLPRSTIDYYDTVERTMGGRTATQSFVRLFLLPGVGHCEGGPGASVSDYLTYLEDWVEKGQAPDRLTSSHIKLDDIAQRPDAYDELGRRSTFPLDPAFVEFSRPLYPYPLRAKYSGHGDTRNATNFVPVSP